MQRKGVPVAKPAATETKVPAAAAAGQPAAARA
jgi:hypothetical protein